MKKKLIIIGAVVLIIIAIVVVYYRSSTLVKNTTTDTPKVEQRKPGQLLPGEIRGLVGKGETKSPEDMAAGSIKFVLPVKK